VHTGCAHCWAQELDGRRSPILDARGRPFVVAGKRQASHFGRGRPRRVTAESGWKLPVRWARAAAKASKRMLVAPLDCDPLDAEVYLDGHAWEGDGLRAGRQEFDRFMDLIFETGEMHRPAGGTSGKAPGITWLILSKRPENWRWVPPDVRPSCWLIYSASDQPSLAAGMPHLLEAQGFAGLGLSLEPLVGPIDLSAAFCLCQSEACPLPGTCERRRGLSWVIIGGESGSGARPCRLEWIRSLVEQRRVGIATYVKQTGSEFSERATGPVIHRPHGGTDLSILPEDLRVREWPDFGSVS